MSQFPFYPILNKKKFPLKIPCRFSHAVATFVSFHFSSPQMPAEGTECHCHDCKVEGELWERLGGHVFLLIQHVLKLENTTHSFHQSASVLVLGTTNPLLPPPTCIMTIVALQSDPCISAMHDFHWYVDGTPRGTEILPHLWATSRLTPLKSLDLLRRRVFRQEE